MAIEFDNSVNPAAINFGNPSLLDNMNPLTVCAWINPINWGSSSFGRIITKEATTVGWMFVINNNTQTETFGFQRYRTGTDAVIEAVDNSIDLNVWQHVALTYQDSGMALYLNGAAVSTQTYTVGSGSPNLDSSTNLYVANRSFTGRGFNGLIEDVRCYERYLSPGEIGGIYAARGHDGIWQNKVAHWRFNEGIPGNAVGETAGSVKDITDNKLHGVSIDDNLTDWAEGIIAPRGRV